MNEVLAPPLQALKVAARGLVQAVGGGEAAAGFCRVSQQVLSTYGNVNVTTAFMPIDVVEALENITVGQPGAPHVTSALAAAQGYALVPLPKPRPEHKSWVAHVCCLSKDVSDIIGPLAAKAEAGITKKDVREGNWLAEADELIRAAVEFRAALLQVGDE